MEGRIPTRLGNDFSILDGQQLRYEFIDLFGRDVHRIRNAGLAERVTKNLITRSAAALITLRPVVHQVGDVGAAQSGCEVPTFSGRERFLQRTVRYRKDTDAGWIREETIVRTEARNVSTPTGSIAENAGLPHGAPIIAIATRDGRGVRCAGASELRGRQVVINLGRIALGPTSLLVYERLNAGKLRCGEGSSTSAVVECVHGYGIVAGRPSFFRV